MTAAKVRVIAFDGISPFHLSVPCLIFGEHRPATGLPHFDFQICSFEAASITSRTGLSIPEAAGLEALADADIVIVPSWKNLDQPIPPALRHSLIAAHQRGALLVGLCLGAFAIAATGLLEGRRIATHWAHCDQLQALHPAIKVDSSALYVDEGDIVTSAGVAAGIDCLLHVVRARYGVDAAQMLARHIVAAPHRQGGQAQFIERPVAKSPNADRFDRAINDVREELAAPHHLDRVAQAAGLTRRTFTRRFQKFSGTSFGEWLAAERIALAQQLLETTNRSIDDIAFETGFGSATSLRQHFSARLNTSPQRYRREFSRVIFGQNVIPDAETELRVGDAVRVIMKDVS